MKRRKQTLITPVWAQKIEVEIEGDVLLICGWGHLSYYPETKDSGGLNLLERLRRYVLRQLRQKTGASEAGTYQFADAADDEKLLAFVSEFGPVWGEVRSSREDPDGTETLTVVQDLKTLRREQQVFSNAVELLRQVNRNSHADVKAIVTALATISQPQERSNSIALQLLPTQVAERLRGIRPLTVGTSMGEIIASFATIGIFELLQEKPDRQKIIECAHGVLCHLFNRYYPLLIPYQGQTVELPCIAAEGIRQALYFKLRLDYQAQRAIGTCVNCGGHFPVLKRGARACGETCRRALRSQKYWAHHSEAINRKRRQNRVKRRK
jgi:hypothetical protein